VKRAADPGVVVVGAGPAGAALSFLLTRAGVAVTLVEREAEFERVFRGEGLLPLGLDALARMGLDWTINDVPGRPVERWRIVIDGDEVLTVPEPVRELGDRAFRVASPGAIVSRLVAGAARHRRFNLLSGWRFVDVVRDSDRRVRGIVVASGRERSELAADLVIGSDGRSSRVRATSGLQLHRDKQQYDVVWFKAPPPAVMADRCEFWIMVRAGRHPLVAYTSWDGRLQAGLIMPSGSLATLPDDWLAESVQAAPDWFAQHVRAHRDEVDGPVKLAVVVGIAPSWSTPGVLLLGDAAHPMSPVRAQGINLALRDAVIAANHLIPALIGNNALDTACLAVEAERRPEIVRAQRLQRREAQGQGDARSGGWRFRVAKRGARILGRYRWAQRAWLARQRELRFGSQPVHLTVQSKHDTDSVG
jgi:2-polyprenyl-6-methoxyphenol hydroxylase-like FAD-dependent oxidoreductase